MWGEPGRGKCVGSLGLSHLRAGTCQRAGAVPTATYPVPPPHVPMEPRELTLMGSTVARLWGRGDRHHLGAGWLWWLCHHHALGPWFALLCWVFFAVAWPAKLGCLRDMPSGRTGLALAPILRTEREVPSEEGTRLEMVALGRAAGTHTSPCPDPLADALRDPVLPAGGDCPSAVGLFQCRLQ